MRDGYADLDAVRLHYVEVGEGPLVLLLHGFPEFWYGWRAQLEPLAAAGFRVVAPTRAIWGQRDAHLTPALAEPARAGVPNLERVIRLDTSHWVHHEAPEEVTRLLAEFFSLP